MNTRKINIADLKTEWGVVVKPQSTIQVVTPPANKEQVIAYIEDNFKEESVCNDLDQEILQWLDEDWNDEFESEYDWYGEYGNGEAEDVVRKYIVNSILTKSGLIIDTDVDLNEVVNEIFPILDK